MRLSLISISVSLLAAACAIPARTERVSLDSISAVDVSLTGELLSVNATTSSTDTHICLERDPGLAITVDGVPVTWTGDGGGVTEPGGSSGPTQSCNPFVAQVQRSALGTATTHRIVLTQGSLSATITIDEANLRAGTPTVLVPNEGLDVECGSLLTFPLPPSMVLAARDEGRWWSDLTVSDAGEDHLVGLGGGISDRAFVVELPSDDGYCAPGGVLHITSRYAGLAPMIRSDGVELPVYIDAEGVTDRYVDVSVTLKLRAATH
jgi:hypothetical protein